MTTPARENRQDNRRPRPLNRVEDRQHAWKVHVGVVYRPRQCPAHRYAHKPGEAQAEGLDLFSVGIAVGHRNRPGWRTYARRQDNDDRSRPCLTGGLDYGVDESDARANERARLGPAEPRPGARGKDDASNLERGASLQRPALPGGSGPPPSSDRSTIP